MKRRKRIQLSTRQLVNGTFQLTKFNNEGRIIYEGPTFNNTVLNVGLDSWFNNRPASWFSWCNVGTDATEPDPSQSQLFSWLASVSDKISTSIFADPGPPTWVSRRSVFEFPIGSCTGNLTEVGLSINNNADYFNRQLLKDQEGNPTTITVLENEGIRVTAEIFIYADFEPGEVRRGGFTYNEELIECDVRYDTDLHLITSTGLGSSSLWRVDGPATKNLLGVVPARDHLTAKDFPSGDTSWRRNFSLESYVPGSFTTQGETTYDAGVLVGDFNCFQIGQIREYSSSYGTRANALHFFNLDETIHLTDVEEFTISAKTTWGRYEGGT